MHFAVAVFETTLVVVNKSRFTATLGGLTFDLYT